MSELLKPAHSLAACYNVLSPSYIVCSLLHFTSDGAVTVLVDVSPHRLRDLILLLFQTSSELRALSLSQCVSCVCYIFYHRDTVVKDVLDGFQMSFQNLGYA